VDPRPENNCAYPKRTLPANDEILRSTLGHYRGSNRVFAYRALADGIFADRRGRWDRLRPWKIGSDCCSHEGQRSDT
jgi:hypothetical protein